MYLIEIYASHRYSHLRLINVHKILILCNKNVRRSYLDNKRGNKMTKQKWF